MHKWAIDGLQGGWERILKQTSTPYTGPLLALHTSRWSVECIGPQLKCDTKNLLSTRCPLFVDDADSAQCDLLLTMHLTVVQNTDSFETELLWYGRDAIRIQYRNIWYDV